jgi:hypothetical protein
MIGTIVLILAIAGSLAWLWSGGIDYMAKNHPDYKGDDFLKWDIKPDDINKVAGRDVYDEDLYNEIY